jgi:hypothetical protein
MQFTSDLQIKRIAEGLIKRTLPRSEWTHAAHFAAAAWLMTSGEHEAFSEMPGLIWAYNESVGTPNTDTEGYHETITIASLRATRSMLACEPVDQPLYEAVNRILRSELGDSDWLLNYWSKNRLFSKEARARWLEPDRVPFPFD